MGMLDDLFRSDALRRFAAARDGVTLPAGADAAASDWFAGFGGAPAAAAPSGGWLGDIASKMGNFYLDSVSPMMDVSKYRKPLSMAPGYPDIDSQSRSLGSDPRFDNVDLPPSTNDPQAREPQVFEDGVPLPRPKPQSGLNGTRDMAPSAAVPGAEAMAAAPGDMPFGDPSDSAVPMPATGPGAIPVAQQRGVPLSMAPGGKPMASAGVPSAPAPSGEPGGFGGLISRILDPSNAPIFFALGAAAGAGSPGEAIGRASAALGPAAALQRQSAQKSTGIAATYRALIARGVPPNEALAAVYNPEVMKATATKYFEAKPLVPHKLGTDMAGNDIMGSFNPNTGKYYDAAGREVRAPDANGEGGSTAAGVGGGMQVLAKGVQQYDPTLPGEQYLEQFGPEVQSAIKAYVRGDSMPMSNPRLKSLNTNIKLWAQTYGEKTGIPVSDATYSSRRAFRTQLGSGSAASIGGQIKAFNQGIEHAASLADEMLKLDNSSGLGMPKVAQAVNTLRQEFSTDQKAVAAKAAALGQTLAGEVGKLFSGSAGGGVHEREMTRQRFDTVKSPAELAGALEATLDTMEGGLHALEQRRDEVMGPNSDIQLMSDKTRQKIEHIRNIARQLRGEVAAPAASPAVTPLAPGEVRSIDGVTIRRVN